MRRLAVFSAVCLSLGLSLSAAAQPQDLVYEGEGNFECQDMDPCNPDAPMCDPGEDCTQVGEFDGYWCNRGYDAFVCCGTGGTGDPDSKCVLDDGPLGVGATGTCYTLEGDESIDGVEGVCQFNADPSPDVYAPTFCEMGVSGSVVKILEDCTTTPEGEPTESWNEGDCDDDGWANGIDFEFGCGSCDMSNFPTGADTYECVQPDLPPEDAGLDAATGPDTSTTPSAPTGPNFRGTGGCACESAGGPLDAPTAPALLVIALFLVRSTRRAGRGS